MDERRTRNQQNTGINVKSLKPEVVNRGPENSCEIIHEGPFFNLLGLYLYSRERRDVR